MSSLPLHRLWLLTTACLLLLGAGCSDSGTSPTEEFDAGSFAATVSGDISHSWTQGGALHAVGPPEMIGLGSHSGHGHWVLMGSPLTLDTGIEDGEIGVGLEGLWPSATIPEGSYAVVPFDEDPLESFNLGLDLHLWEDRILDVEFGSGVVTVHHTVSGELSGTIQATGLGWFDPRQAGQTEPLTVNFQAQFTAVRMPGFEPP